MVTNVLNLFPTMICTWFNIHVRVNQGVTLSYMFDGLRNGRCLSTTSLYIGWLSRAAMAELASMEKEGIDGGDGPGGRRDGVVSRLPATPLYNSAVLEDMCMKEHLAALHGLCGKSQAFRDAIVLGKVMPSFVLLYSIEYVYGNGSSSGAAVCFSICDCLWFDLSFFPSFLG